MAKILIVEDQEITSVQIKYELESAGYEITGIARNKDEALDSIERNVPDLALIDISLTGVNDGIELAQIISEKYKLPFIYLTSNLDDKTLQQAKNTEPYGYVLKSVPKKELLIHLEFALYKINAEREREFKKLELLRLSEQFDAVANNCRDAVIILDEKCEITFWNDSAKRTFGYSSEEVLGKRFSDLIIVKQYAAEFLVGYLKAAIKGSSEMFDRVLEIYAQKKNGSIIPAELYLTSVKLLGKWHCCCTARDVSLRIAAEEELSRLIEEIQVTKDIIEQHASELMTLNHKLFESEEQLRELNVSKDKFFSIIAHDLKGPFQGLLGYSRILAEDLDKLNKEEISEIANTLNVSAEQLFKLLENLLHWSRLQRGHIEYNPESFQIQQIVDMNFLLIQPRAAQKKIALVNNVDGGLCVYADVNMINTVLRNLLSNALKFSNEGGSVGVEANLTEDGKVAVTVFDNGVGMNQIDIIKAFKIDSHFSTPGTLNEQGTGLGLILCRELVEKNKGTITAQSKPGEGSRFTFQLPSPPQVLS